MHLEDTTAVVTGGGSGIGRALAVAFAAAGSHVVIGDVNADGAAETAERVRASGGHAVAQRADASAIADIQALIDLAHNTFGHVDVYIANAGIIGAPDLGAESDWDRIIDVNLRAHIRAATLLVPQWLERKSGHFVSIASAAGLLTQLGAAGYAVTKHAAVGFAEWLAITYGDNGIGVTCVCPMGVETPLLDAARESSSLAGDSITKSGVVIEPQQVAEMTVDAVRNGRFLVLPHPKVATMFAQKASDHDRWIAGMQRYQRSLGS
ncbi:SDR family oxidoreductase [Mycobacterium hubeiense]|uniref:SDR family oxidoreductase n=1 Tax=Mycobacterium hubeiense TaxID=1867256 RepID=UPI000C7EEF61|nr:SDR family NAD(P)-dependent oxidoreductase [Mycobacterium sp. QGD 101]